MAQEAKSAASGQGQEERRNYRPGTATAAAVGVCTRRPMNFEEIVVSRRLSVVVRRHRAIEQLDASTLDLVARFPSE